MRHIMKHYAHYGFRDFVIALGYKSEYIKRYLVEYIYYNDTNLRVDLRDGSVSVQRNGSVEREDWTLDPVETGYETATAGPDQAFWPPSSRIVLAVHGHAPGQEAAGGSVGRWRPAVEGLDVTP
jgi:hypothetical protein